MGTLLNDAELTVEVRLYELLEEVISFDAAATIAARWHSVFAPQLMILSTYVDPFTEPEFGLYELETEARTEQRLMMADRTLSDAEKARYTREFEALYAWIASVREPVLH